MTRAARIVFPEGMNRGNRFCRRLNKDQALKHPWPLTEFVRRDAAFGLLRERNMFRLGEIFEGFLERMDGRRVGAFNAPRVFDPLQCPEMALDAPLFFDLRVLDADRRELAIDRVF